MSQYLVPVGFLMLAWAVFSDHGSDQPVEPAKPTISTAERQGYGKAQVSIPVQGQYANQPNPMANRGEVVLMRQSDGHFYTDAMVNGSTVRFLVDTGASSVALSRADADRIGLSAADDAYTGIAMGAGGAIAVRTVVLDRVAVGSFEATQVRGAVVKEGLEISLLGQSYLSQIGKVTIEGDRMTLR